MLSIERVWVCVFQCKLLVCLCAILQRASAPERRLMSTRKGTLATRPKRVSPTVWRPRNSSNT